MTFTVNRMMLRAMPSAAVVWSAALSVDDHDFPRGYGHVIPQVLTSKCSAGAPVLLRPENRSTAGYGRGHAPQS